MLILFDLDTADPNYDAASGTWLFNTTANNGALPEVEGGNVTIDGFTETDGTISGPPIVIGDSSLTVGSTVFSEGGNIIRGLLFLNNNLVIVSDDSFVEENWFGFTPDGQNIFFPTQDGEPSGSQRSGVRINQEASGVVVRDNHFVGSGGIALDVEGDDNFIVNNTIGTRLDGTVPAPPNPANRCVQNPDTGNWFGGNGLQLSGSRNQVTDNIIAGMLQIGSTATALNMGGSRHFIANNLIGVGSDGTSGFLCGFGIQIDGEFSQVISNTIANSDSTAYFIGIDRFGAYGVTLRNNVVRDVADYADYSTQAPIAFTTFRPAVITGIDGTTVTGTSAPGYPCPFCTVEVFLEDDDDLVETLESLAVVTATADGDWTATLPRPLAAGEFLRTLSTANDLNIISGFETGTTVPNPSILYPITGLDAVDLVGPTAGEVNTTYVYTATISPLDAGRPISITASATDLNLSPVLISSETTDAAVYELSWGTTGVKTLVVTATNDISVVTDSLEVLIGTPLTPLESVEITGPAMGSTGIEYSFTATVSPNDATTPVSYTWTVDDQDTVSVSNGLSNEQTYTWDTPGTRTLTVTAENSAGAPVEATFEIIIEEAVATPPASVELTGPESGMVGVEYSFTARVTPSETTRPITFTWEADDQLPVTGSGNAINNTQRFTWDSVGTRTLTVTVDNGLGIVSDTVQIDITEMTTEPVPVTGVTISGPSVGEIGTAYTFEAAVSPNNATTPVSYTWVADDLAVTPVIVTDGLTNTQSFTWEVSGTKTVTVTAFNGSGEPVSDEFQIDIRSFTRTTTLVSDTATTFEPAPNITIQFPAGTVSDTVNIEFSDTSTRPLPENTVLLRRIVLLGEDTEGATVSSTDNEFQVFVILDESVLPDGTTSEDVLIYYWDGSAWVLIDDVNRPGLAQALTFSFSTNLLTEFVVVVPEQTNENFVYLPLVRRIVAAP
ncbi:MAG: PKD domain-containing protein [Chloroflexaceae bacterium]|nr:PKD domain-containing protein [Chloroflexaceae bacterium]